MELPVSTDMLSHHNEGNPSLFNFEIHNDTLHSLDINETLKTIECFEKYFNKTSEFQAKYPAGFCTANFDSISCWPTTPLDTRAVLKCFSEFNGYKYDDTRFGISSKCWDLVFGTFIQLKKLSVAIRW